MNTWATEQKAVKTAKKSKSAAASKRSAPQKAQKTQLGGSQPYAQRDDAQAWAKDVAERRNLDLPMVQQALAEARLLPTVQRLMSPAPVSFQKNWKVYRSRFIDEVRIQAGLKFWAQHADTLQRAQAEHGVPAEVIVGIIGVETIFGRDQGSFRVLDALTTLAFDFPKSHPKAATRQAFFRDELEQFLSLCARSGRSPEGALGSYAGAMGYPQFMPSSWAKHALDFDGDGKVDLWGSPADAIGSVANYLKAYGWQAGKPTRYAAQFDAAQTPEQKAALLAPDILPSFTPDDLGLKGMALDAKAKSHDGLLALVELFNGNDAPSYVLGTQNFYTITRYNWSSYYALAVIELGEAIAARR